MGRSGARYFSEVYFGVIYEHKDGYPKNEQKYKNKKVFNVHHHLPVEQFNREDITTVYFKQC